MTEDLFRTTTRLELFRRMRAHAAAHLQSLVDANAPAATIASVRDDLKRFDEIISFSDYGRPLDTPVRRDPPPAEPQPLCPPGTEIELSGFISLLLEETTK